MNQTYNEKVKYIYFKRNKNRNFSLKKSIYSRAYKKFENSIFNSYPIKPFQNIIPNDINLQKLFMNQKISFQYINKLFSFMSNININNSINRKKILNNIKEFILIHRIEYKIYYKIIILYDILLIENESKKLLSEEDIGLGALVLSVKFNYIENKMISMKNFLNLYDDKIYSLNKLIKIERMCLQLTKYFLNYNTPMCFLEFFLINGIIFNTDSIKEDNYIKIYQKVEQVLEKIMEESNNYLKYNFFYLACSIVSYVREIFELEKWPFPLRKIFGIDYIDFEKEYLSIINKNYKDNNNSENKKEIIIKGDNSAILLNIQNKFEKMPKTLSRIDLYKKNSNNLNNKYCNNIINININNYTINNNNIKSCLYKNGLKKEKNFDNFKTNINEISEEKGISEEKKLDMKIINKNILKHIENKINVNDGNKSQTAFCSPNKKNRFDKLKINKEIYKKNLVENLKNSPKEIIDGLNTTSRNNKNYNFSSRFKLNNSQSSYNINSFLFEKNQSNNEQNSKLVELKNTIKEYDKNKIRFKKSEITPKNLSINLGYTSGTKHNKAGKKILGMKEIVNSNVFVTRSKSKDNFKINFVKNDKDKKENKTRNKIRYNNLIKYKLSISSSSYKTKAFKY